MPGYVGIARWLYRGGRPNRLARLLNKGWAIVHALGLWPDRLVTLEVPGRRSGEMISLPLVLADLNGERYAVSMLGEDANWVRNVRAAGGDAVLRHGRSEMVRLVEVDSADRAPILRRYLSCAPGARAHVPVARDASLTDIQGIASCFPVFRISTRS